jgi:hypothetical protein
MVIARDERQILPASKQNASDAVWLVGWFDEEFGDVPDEMAILVVGLSA